MRTLLLSCALCATAAADDRADFFETKVRPLLAAHCQDCHNADAQEGGVRLDRASGVFADLGDGPVVAKGDAAGSRLMEVVAYDPADIQTPPDGKLSEADAGVLRKWIADGAYWPEEAEEAAEEGWPRTPEGTIDFAAAAEKHWAYRPVADPPVPDVAGAEVRTSVDAFIAERLRNAGLEQNPLADRRTIIRRLSFDLIGLPPTFEEVRAFEADESPEAVEKLVDRLLADPRYGERWARHWLDVARYADTTGYRTANKTREYPYAYTFRDWVVASLNEDLPYDEFVKRQIAADVLYPDDPASHAALGLLSVGPVFTDNPEEQINDRIDVVTRGFLATTVACARCHDHKFDPVPTRDFYSLYGVFWSTEVDDLGPVIGESPDPAGSKAYAEELAKRQGEADRLRDEAYAAFQTEHRTRTADYLVAAAAAEGFLSEGSTEGVEARGVRGWQSFLKNFKGHPVGRVWHELKSLKDLPNEAAAKLQEVPYGPPTRAYVDRLRAAAAAGDLKTMADVTRILGDLMSEADAAPDDPSLEWSRKLFTLGPAPTNRTRDNFLGLVSRKVGDPILQADKKVNDLRASHPHAPPRAMSVSEKGNGTDVQVFVRGNSGRRGEAAPRRAPQILRLGPDRVTEGSGRRELAEAIAHPDNPLTARVLVNRLWQHHFGRGLVETASDFGTQGEPPSHPELLDHLAAEFVRGGWSVKDLHRRIVLSHTFLQGSRPSAEAAARDPENRLLSHQNRRRLEFEPMRDAMLSVAGLLDAAVGGKPVPVDDLSRRSIYLKVDRDNPPALTQTFDVPSADVTSPGRAETTVPQQALFHLNDAKVRRVAEAAAGKSPDLAALVRRVLSREPTDAERSLLGPVFADDPAAAAQILLMSNEFAFVD